jgi:hypothetical protein
MRALAVASGGRHRRPKRRTTKSRGKAFMVATIGAKGGDALSRSQQQCRLAVLTILAEALNRVDQAFQARAINLLQSLPEPCDMSFR